MKLAQTPHVYFIAPVSGGLIKIGCSKSPPNRLASLLCWSPVPLEILAQVPGTYDDERKVHSLFVAHHSHSEWFHPCLELLGLIETIRATGVLPLDCRGISGQPGLIRTGSGRSRELKSEAMKRAWARKRANGEEWALGWKHRTESETHGAAA